jgi:hypothetical protein
MGSSLALIRHPVVGVLEDEVHAARHLGRREAEPELRTLANPARFVCTVNRSPDTAKLSPP